MFIYTIGVLSGILIHVLFELWLDRDSSGMTGFEEITLFDENGKAVKVFRTN